MLVFFFYRGECNRPDCRFVHTRNPTPEQAKGVWGLPKGAGKGKSGDGWQPRSQSGGKGGDGSPKSPRPQGKGGGSNDRGRGGAKSPSPKKSHPDGRVAQGVAYCATFAKTGQCDKPGCTLPRHSPGSPGLAAARQAEARADRHNQELAAAASQGGGGQASPKSQPKAKPAAKPKAKAAPAVAMPS